MKIALRSLAILAVLMGAGLGLSACDGASDVTDVFTLSNN